MENIIQIEVGIKYSDNAVQVWRYDVNQYESVDALKKNMAQDFASPRSDRKHEYVMIRTPEIKAVDFPAVPDTGMSYADLVFLKIEGLLNGN